ncbi:MAG TPA: MaoC family dehydratase N-terminal domain-containing protein [Amycolatopsis sp.]|nr:MaoC family dehydratase N-terminal domain-containing protein [Amycolatopsis sp.]
MTAFAMAHGTWEDAERLVGTVIAELSGADAVNDAMVRHQLEALEWDSPVFTDDDAARAAGYDGRIAPFSMYLTFGMPAYWKPGMPSLPPNSLAPFAFGAVPAPGSAMLATQTSVEFHDPMRPGDRLSATWRLTGVTRKRLSLGDGGFLDFEVAYRNQDGALVALERTSVFRYDPEPGA